MDMMSVQNSYRYDTIAQSLKDIQEARRRAMKLSNSKANKNTKKKRKKSVNYNAKELSHQLSHASRAAGATRVLIRARGMIEYLQRCAATGDYDEGEIKAALAHARRMVKCARKKVRNMKKEEQIERKGKKGSVSKDIKKDNEIKALIRRELKKLRIKNRNEEQQEISDADMRYLKERIRQQQRSASGGDSSCGQEAATCEATAEAGMEAGEVMAEGAECIEASTVDVVM